MVENTSNVKKFPVQLRIIHRRWPLGHFVQLDRGAGGEYGWLSETRALLISREEGAEKGTILLAAFFDKRPMRCGVTAEHCIRVPRDLCAESVIAARALRAGIKTLGCELFVTMFPSSTWVQILSRIGITRLYYVHTEDNKSPREADLATLALTEVEAIRVSL